MQSSFPTLVALVLLWAPPQISSQEEEDHSKATTISADPNDIRFWNYAAGKPQKEIKYGDKHSMLRSYIQSGSKMTTILLIDGFKSNNRTRMLTNLTNAYTGTPRHNVVVVDWTKLSGYGAPAAEDKNIYERVVGNTLLVAGRVGAFLIKLNEFKRIRFGSIHIVGFDLGAHSCAALMAYDDEQVGRIIGLDPSGPRFGVAVHRLVQLRKSDAIMVDAWYTNRGGLGISVDDGSVNLYVNGAGVNQRCTN